MRTLTPSRALLRAALLACSLALAAASHQFVRLTVDNAQVNLDGVTRIAYTINGQTPGPAIHAVVGDELTIEVVNMLHTEAISLHWHGLIMRDNPWNDGTAFITQYPIPPMTSLNYTVKPTEPGTHWYHSHTGTQFGDGMYGPFIVHEAAPKAEDPPEHIVMISEWYHRTSADIIADMRANVYEAHNPPWISGHINGNGRYDCKSACFDSHVHFQHSLACIPGHNYSVFSMDSTQPTHRLRIISTTTGTTLRFSIDDHPLTVIAIDGRPVKRVQAHVLRVFVGQRYDVLYAPKAAGGLSWMRVRSLNHTDAAPQEVLAIVRDLAQPSAGSDQTEPTSSAWEIGAQGVVEVYDHAGGMVPEDGQPAPPSIEDAKMVVLHTSCMDMMPGMGGGSGSMGGGGSMGGMPGMPGMGPMPATNGSTPRSHQGHRCTVNDISFHSPSKPVGLCLIDNSPLPTGIVHNVSLSHGDKALVALNNEGMQGHPWHLHGHGFWILGAGMEGEGNFDMEKHKDRLNLKNPLIRDTAHVEAGSWLLLLFEADNPGFWPFHCHVEWHLDAGLAMLFLEAVDRIPPPPPSMPVTTTFADRTKPADAMAQMTQAQFFGVGMLTGVFIGVAVAFGAQRCFAPGDRKSSGKYTRVSSAEDHANHNGDTALQDVQVAGGGVNKQFSIGDDEPHSTQETELQPL